MDSVDPLDIPEPKYKAWKCPKCYRVYIFESGQDKAKITHKIEE